MSERLQVICKSCRKTYIVQGESGKTLKCQCPFCGTPTTIVAPLGSSGVNFQKESKTSGFKNLSIGKKVVLIFLLLFLLLIISASVLYIVFSTMSN